MREGIPEASRPKSIGYVMRGAGQLRSLDGAVHKDVLDRIEQWRVHMILDAVIWTDLGSNFEERAEEGKETPFNSTTAVTYLHGLKQRGSATAAEEYVRRAPAQVRTEIREHIEEEFGATPQY